MGALFQSIWSPYLAGAGIGILSWLSFLLSDKPLACSTSFTRTSGLIEGILRKSRPEREYYVKFKPEIDWQWMLVFGVFLGSFLSSILSGEFKLELVPPLWLEMVGNLWFPRFLVAFVGGVAMGIGSRWAGGCTSGHGISGTLQLTLSSWLAVFFFFFWAILFAHLFFQLLGRL